MSIYRKAWDQGTDLIRWMGGACLDTFRNPGTPLDIIFCMVDHYEPASRRGREVSRENIDRLLSEYPRLADGHRDHEGHLPRRTWFFPPHHHKYGILKDLVLLCKRGYGEIEFHLHHGKTAPDDEANLRRTIKQAILEYGEFGIFGSEDERKKYGFIHGDWALANSRHGPLLRSQLRDRGIKADRLLWRFHLPQFNRGQPRQNRLDLLCDE